MKRYERGRCTTIGKGFSITPHVRVTLLTFLCFLLSSAGWLSWLYHLTDIAAPSAIDILTMGVGYIMQAIGIASYALLLHSRGERQTGRLAAPAAVAFTACLIPATLAPTLAPTLAFGYLFNLLCGYVQGHYLFCLARFVDESHRGIVFGSAYAAATLVSWVLSVIAHGMLTTGIPALICCVVLTVPTFLLARDSALPYVPPTKSEPLTPQHRQIALLACVVVLLMSVTKSLGFSFPTSDLIGGVSLELTRLFYEIGLIAAGILSDHDRRYGALCCASALVAPFLMLALSGATAPATLLWVLGYFLTGFFSVFRVVLLTDLAAEYQYLVISGCGLLFGRLGEAAGAIAFAGLSGVPLALISVTAVLFACTIGLFFVLYQSRYIPSVEAVPSEREIFESFAARHDLSAREREVLRLVLDEHSNSEIATELFVSEATVKFHVRNLLRKTGCKSRLEIISLYNEPIHHT